MISFPTDVNVPSPAENGLTNGFEGISAISPIKRSDSEGEQKMLKPAFKIGSLTNVYANQTNLGSLAALANYNNEEEKAENDLETTGENMSSFSAHSAWDNYQDKYNSEAYSEDKDTEAARRLLEFGDDYRTFLDSQSDCCSSLSAANLDSMSPPRFRRNLPGSPGQNKSLSSTADSSLEMMRRKRIMELPETERRRKNILEGLLMLFLKVKFFSVYLKSFRSRFKFHFKKQ